MDWSSIFSPLNVTVGVLVITILFFVQGKVRSDLVALCSLLALMLFGILDTQEALAGFSNSVVLMMVGLFVVGGGIFRTGLARIIGFKILNLAKGNENLLFILIMLVTAVIGAFVSNTGTVAIMMPIIVSMAYAAKLNLRRYLMPLAFASAMGIFTLISTPPNMVIQEQIVKNGFEPLSFFSFAPIGAIAVLVGIVVLFFTSKLLKGKQEETSAKKGKSLIDLIEEYNLKDNLWKVTVPDESSITGQSLEELQLTSDYGIGIGKIIHRDKAGRILKRDQEEIAKPDSVIEKGDTLYCHGSLDNINRFLNDYGLTLSDISENERKSGFSEYGLAEAIILPNSHLENQTVIESRFREHYHVNVVGIKDSNSELTRKVKDRKLATGDILLISGKWDDIVLLSDNQHDFVIIGQPEKEAMKVTYDKKAPLAAGILALMVITMAFNLLPAVTAVLIAGALMVITG